MKNTYKILSITTIAFLSVMTLKAQVKIGANPTIITSTSALEVEATGGSKVAIDKTTGKVGVGTVSPSNMLHVAATADPLKLVGVQGATTAISPLGIDASGVVKSMNLATSTLALSTGNPALTCTAALNFNAWTDIPGLSQTFTLAATSNVNIYSEIFLGQNNASTSDGFAQGFMILEIDGSNDDNSIIYAPMIHNPGGSNYFDLMNKSAIQYTVALAAGSHTIKARYYLASLLGSTTGVQVCPAITGWAGSGGMTSGEQLKATTGKLRVTY